jgi:hypothetical protein
MHDFPPPRFLRQSRPVVVPALFKHPEFFLRALDRFVQPQTMSFGNDLIPRCDQYRHGLVISLQIADAVIRIAHEPPYGQKPVEALGEASQ